MSREVIASNGSLDFHFSYTKNDVLMNVCVELKNAHHPNLEHGLTTQLPLYINDIGSREGIFLVLWYKYAKFNKPSAFNNIKECEEFLLGKSPKKFRIKPLIIDCSPKASPSLKSSKKRLE
jgi:internalin A